MLSRFVKKSIASKFFLMNIIILISIIGSQLIFQALYFEKYYLGKKEKNLESSIKDFQEFLRLNRSDEEIMSYIDKIQREENITIAIRNNRLSGGYSLEPHMGLSHIVLVEKGTNIKYRVIIGDQYPKLIINKGDRIDVIGRVDKYGYITPVSLSVNGKVIQPFYEIIPKQDIYMDNEEAMTTIPALPLGTESFIQGSAIELVPENKSYSIISNSDLYLNMEEKNNILNMDEYVTRTKALNSLDEILLVSKRLSNGYLISMTPLTQVNDLLGNMSSYYLLIFLFALLIVVLVSLVYSKYITKPLVEMSNVAKKISECDFEYKVNVRSEDELGELGNSLNSISHNLEKSLNDLQNTNEKLKEEMNIKNLQEEKRKELIANISHELKTPITIIQGSINGVKSGVYTEDMYEDILEETNKMNELVKEMLEISRLESPNFTLNKEAFDLVSIFLKEKDKLKSMILEKNLKIIYNDFEEAVGFGDEKRINQVVTNLLTNAIKYTPECGEIKVDITLNEDEYLFSIENFGTTLSSEEINRIWEPFYRKEKSRNKSFGGTGLGLSIVKRILEIHNSDFGVVSTENSVRFYFTISKCLAY